MAGETNGKWEITFDFDDCTLEELEFVEDYVGLGVGEIVLQIQARRTSARTLRALAYIVKRRENPNFDMDELATVKFGALNLEGGETDPTVGSDEPTPTKKAGAAATGS